MIWMLMSSGSDRDSESYANTKRFIRLTEAILDNKTDDVRSLAEAFEAP